jgi:pimeloyl-ACP methyl ester carboxylesterase
MPVKSGRYSYVRRAVAAGYATLAIDRLGAGDSTHPPSTSVTLEAGARALHDVVHALRCGAVGGHAFSRVIYVADSLGAIYGWTLAALYKNTDDGCAHTQRRTTAGIDAFALTSELHAPTKPSFVAGATPDIVPADSDPAFAGLGFGPGYITTLAGTRDDLFYYAPTTDLDVLAADEHFKGTASATEFGQGLSPIPPPELAPSRAISVPTLVLIGEQDGIYCGPPDGLTCRSHTLFSREKPFYSPDAHLRVMVMPQTGHSMILHKTAPIVDTAILLWIRAATGSSIS